MDQIDVLGSRPDRHGAFVQQLLAETEDTELQQIVESAARDLATPIALVSLVLDQIQFFKAHFGLPPDLRAARGTRRDVSFCQFVVRDGETFEVQDARNDERVPQHLVKEYGISSYLGIPINVGDTVIGSLCVIDTQERRFTETEHEQLKALAAMANERVTVLAEGRRQRRLALSEEPSGLGLAELRESLAPIRGFADTGLPAMQAIRSFLRLSAHVLEGGEASSEVLKRTLEAASEAADAAENALYDVEAAAADCEDCTVALTHLIVPSSSARLSEVLTAAQDLARQSTRQVGGAPLPDMLSDPVIHTPRPLAIALVSTLLASLAAHLAERQASSGIQMQVRDLGATTEVAISAENLPEAKAEEITSELCGQMSEDPSVAIRAAPDAVVLAFMVVESPQP